MRHVVNFTLQLAIFAATCAAGEMESISLEVESMVGAADWVETHEAASEGKWVRLSRYNLKLEGNVHLPAGPVVVAVHGHRDDSESDGFQIQIDDGLLQRVSMGGDGVRSFTEFFAEAGEHRIVVMSDVKDKGVCLDVVRFTPQRVQITPWQTEMPDTTDGRTRLATQIQCSFDEVEEGSQPGPLFADYVRGNARPNVRTVVFETPPGGESIAAHFVTSGSSIVFDGLSNCRTDRGRVDFRVRADEDSNLWADGKDHGLFGISAFTEPSFYGRSGEPFRLSLEKRASGNAIVLQLTERNMLWLPVAGLAPTEWHQISIAWRIRDGGGRMWLAVNGVGVSAPITQRIAPTPPEGIVLGNTLRDAYWGMDAYVDDFRLGEDAPDDGVAGVLDTDAVDFDLAFRAQEALRRWLRLQQSLAPDGLWHYWYGWPVKRFFISKGSRVPRGTEQISMKAGGPTRVATQMLHAFEVLGDWRHLQLARRTGAFLLKAQQPEGHWLTAYAIPDGEPQGRDSIGRIQDHYQSDPVIFLVYLHRVTGDERYLQSAVRCADFLVAAQNSNGSWGGNFDAETGVGATSVQNAGGGGEFNDAGISAPLATLLLMHHVTGDGKYREAALRAFDWVLAAELTGGKGRGWAQQYDAQNNPVWARFHEPPVICPRVFAYYVGDLMLWAYRLTGETKYVEAIRPTVEWMRSVQRPDGFHFYYDITSGKPVYGRDFKIYPYYEDPGKNKPAPAGFAGYYPYNISHIETALRAIDADSYEPERWKPIQTTRERESRRKIALAKLRENDLDDGKAAWVAAGRGGWIGTLEEAIEEQYDWGGWLAPRYNHGYDIEDRSSVLFRYVELVRVACDLASADLETSDGSGGLGTSRAWFIDGGFDAPRPSRDKRTEGR